MKNFSSKILLGLVIAVAGFSASAQEFKVGVVNLDRIFREANEMFAEVSWLQVLHGQRVQVKGYHPLVDLYSEEKIVDFLASIRGVIGNCVQAMPSHDDFIARNCATAD